ncbi:histidine phosphatase family protein [Candidatus Daviesbacteria bacterium]|nr:histidine phosphatase family protein [Candidatus Daviesbacteria bacterium]
MKVYVIRHGITELNKAKKVNGQIDEPLAPEGCQQAEAAVSLLPKSIKHIYTSPLLRTKQTAEIINSKLNRPISLQNELTEIHMGSLAGKAWTDMEAGLELKKKHRTVQFDYQPYGGESAKEVKKRVLVFLKKINGKHGDHEALIVTHGGIIRVLHMLEHNEQIIEDIEHISPHTFDLGKIIYNI